MDFSFQGTYQKIEFKRFYFSNSAMFKPIGYGWTHNFNTYLKVMPGSNTILLLTPAGKVQVFNRHNGMTYFLSTSGKSSYIWSSSDSYPESGSIYKWREDSGTDYIYQYAYSNSGSDIWRLKRIEYTSGQHLKFSYATQSSDTIQRMYDATSNRGADFQYNDGEIQKVTMDSGNTIGYQYDGNSNLALVTQNGGTYYKYYYTESRYLHFVTRVDNKAGQVVEELSYDGNHRAIGEVNSDHTYQVTYGNTAGEVTLTDLNNSIANNIVFDTRTHRVLQSDQCLSSCSGMGGRGLLYDGHNNKIINENNTGITQSFYDWHNNFKGSILLSSLDRTTGSFTDDFTDPDVNALYWKAPNAKTSWVMLPNHILLLKPVGGDSFYFSSKGLVSLKGNFEIDLKYHIVKDGSNPYTPMTMGRLSMFVVSESEEDTWVKLDVGHETTPVQNKILFGQHIEG